MSNSPSPEINYQALLKDALISLRELQTEITTLEQKNTEPIAIIGMACRFPGGANTPEAFWQLLQDGVNAVSEIPPQRWDINSYYDQNPETAGKMYTRHGYFIDQVDQFDARFFGISPREAAAIDPQQRLLLEVSYEALERAGQSPSLLKGSRTGVFIGLCFDDYAKYSITSGDNTQINAFTSLGNTRSIAAGRIAYILGLQGPVMQLDTTCSSSLVGVHLACQSLRNGESDMVLVGGVNLMLSPEPTIGFCKLKALAPDGLCKTFDVAADGYGRGEGCGVVVLKKLSDALANRDPILAVIRGSAINHDGASNGLTAPNGIAQENVIRQALKNARIEPAQIQYVETHGTGTVLGDPIEVLALAKVLTEGRNPDNPLQIGSVKTNIGHLESAAGVAGLIKVILALQHQQIPPHLNLQNPNPHIPWDKLNIHVPTKLTPWKVISPTTRLAGISSFGMSGTNVHVILEEAPENPAIKSSSDHDQSDFQTTSINTHIIDNHKANILTLSGKTPTALQAIITQYLNYLQQHKNDNFDNICVTANTGRSHFNYRIALVANSCDAAREKLIHFQNHPPSPSHPENHPQKIAFLFTGQGSQYPNMGQQLYATQPTFRHHIDYCCHLLTPAIGTDLRCLIYPQLFPTTNNFSPLSLNQTIYTQPALFILEYSLCQLWLSWGITPDYLMGHSIGEYVAACIAGVFSLEDGLKLIAHRGRLMQQLPQNGKMVAVMAAVTEIEECLEGFQHKVSIAAINSPENTVIAGENSAIAQVIEILDIKGIKYVELTVSHAFHSPLMEPILHEFAEVASSISYHKPRIPIVANLTGKVINQEIANPEYWCQHIRQPVQFATGMEALAAEGCQVFLEIGAKATLLSLGRNCLTPKTTDNYQWLASLQYRQPDLQVILSSLASLYMGGHGINWSGVVGEISDKQRVILPTYPWEHQRYWIERKIIKNQLQSHHPLLGERLPIANSTTIYFQSTINQYNPEFLQHHRVFNHVILPGAAYVEMILSAAKKIWNKQVFCLRNIVINQGLIISANGDITLQLQINSVPENNHRKYKFDVFSIENNSDNPQNSTWSNHASGLIYIIPQSSEQDRLNILNISELQVQCPEQIDIPTYYQTCRELGIDYGKLFQGIKLLYIGEKQALGKIQLPIELLEGLSHYQIHPAFLDACLQVTGAALLNSQQKSKIAYLPVGIEEIIWHKDIDFGNPIWSYVQLRESNLIDNISDISINPASHKLIADLKLYHPDGSLIAAIHGLQIQPCYPTWNYISHNWYDWLYKIEWIKQPIVTQIRIRDIISHLEISSQLEQYTSLVSELEKLSFVAIIKALRELNFPDQGGEKFSFTSIVQLMGIDSNHQKLFARLLQILAEEGFLKINSDHNWTVLQQLSHPNYTNNFINWNQLQQKYPLYTAELNLFQRCTENLAQVLQGKIEPLQLLFPNGDLSDLTQLYQNSPIAQVMNTSIKQAIIRIIEQIPVHRQNSTGAIRNKNVRILEIGAGTGGTTTYILPELSNNTYEYFFTDISPTFLNQAKQKFSQYPSINYQLLDIEKSGISQGFTENSFDIIIAANALHATKNLHQTITHIKELLSPGGYLVILEGVYPVRWLDLIFGLTEGWWKFQDQELRSDYPLITVDKWQQLLTQEGFAKFTCLNDISDQQKNQNNSPLQQQAIIIAQKPIVNHSPESWLILADKQGLGEQLALNLEAQGKHCQIIFADSDFPSHILPSHLINLWGLDVSHTESLTLENLRLLQKQLYDSVANYLPKLLSLSTSCQWWQITQGAIITDLENVGDNPDKLGLAASTLWGITKVIRQEHPELECHCLDLDTNYSIAKSAEIIFQEIQLNTPEEEIIWRNHHRYVPRLVAYSSSSSEFSKKLGISPRGTLENLEYRDIRRRSPRFQEVEMEIYATGLNFRDVLNALDLYPQADGILGCECVGKIIAVGEEVKHLQVGQTVMGLVSGSFADYVTVNSAMVVPIPDNLDVLDAATIPAAFVTAFYTLRNLAKIIPGQRVLIHAGTGGVGQAAIQIAQVAGAEIYATASPGKWEILRSLGVEHIFNSRSLDFSREIMVQTQGEGVDIVLNSLSGNFIDHSLSILKSQGKFIELGKIGIWSEEQVKRIKPDIDYFPVDLVDLCQREPELIQNILQSLVHEISKNRLKPLPKQVFPHTKIIDAFRYMQQGKHTGKIIIENLNSKRQQSTRVNNQGTYLITGGLGGLGLLAAELLVKKGARHLVLIGRNAPSETARSRVQKMEAIGAKIAVHQVDVCHRQALSHVLTEIAASEFKLTGIIHAAGVLADATLSQMDWQKFEDVIAAKVLGAWNLHTLTQHHSLDFFILFSSATALFGSPGQANHVAANTFLDNLAQYRRKNGLPGMSINWGIWSEVGSATQATTQMQQYGINPISPKQGMEVFEYLLSESASQVGVIPIDWSIFSSKISSRFVENFSGERKIAVNKWEDGNPNQNHSASSSRILEQLFSPGENPYALLDNYVRGEIARILGFKIEEINPKAGFFDLGMDSLTAIEFKNRLQSNLQCSLASTIAFDYPTVEALVKYLADDVLQLNRINTTTTNTMETIVEQTDKQEEMSNESEAMDILGYSSANDLSTEDIASLLAQELQEIQQENFDI